MTEKTKPKRPRADQPESKPDRPADDRIPPAGTKIPEDKDGLRRRSEWFRKRTSDE